MYIGERRRKWTLPEGQHRVSEYTIRVHNSYAQRLTYVSRNHKQLRTAPDEEYLYVKHSLEVAVHFHVVIIQFSCLYAYKRRVVLYHVYELCKFEVKLYHCNLNAAVELII